MRKAIWGAMLALILPACGGGSGQTATLQTELQGVIYEVDGQTVDRSGIEVTVLETGATFFTGEDGSFEFRNLPPGKYTLDFDTTFAATTLRALAQEEGEGEGDGENSGEEGGEGEEDGEGESGGDNSEEEGNGEEEGDGEGEGENDEGDGEGEGEGEGEDDGDNEEEGDGEGEDENDEGEGENDEGEGENDNEGEEGGDGADGEEGEDGAEGEEGEDEREREEGEDRDGRPVIEVTEECGRIEIRIALENGEVKEFTIDEHSERHAKAPLWPAENVERDIEGKIKLTATETRQLFKVEAAPFDPGTVVELFLDAREGLGPISIGTAITDADREATYVRDTGDNDPLPLGARTLPDLAGHRLEVRLAATGQTLLVGEVPDLPEKSEHDCREKGDGEGDGNAEGDREGDGNAEGDREGENEGEADGDRRGKAYLDAVADRVEGSIEIRSWPREEIDRFKMTIYGLAPEDRVAFEIQDPENPDRWILLGIRFANADGVARVDTNEDLDLPFNVGVEELVGLRVRVRRAEEGNDDILLLGRVPELVED